MNKTITVKQVVTSGEIELVKMLADGLTAREIAENRKKSIRTIEGIIDRMRGEYGCENIAHLVATFLRNKLIK